MVILKRTRKCEHGVFGELYNDDGHLAFTLEHYYGDIKGGTKLPIGDYLCVRGVHILNNPFRRIMTFEVSFVPGHSGILFHPGNRDIDSEGCILLGERVDGDVLLNSRIAFEKFMTKMVKSNTFKFRVEDACSENSG